MCDYKPVLPYLFPHLVKPEHKYWGYVDMDVVWGNWTRFAHLFQGQPIVRSGFWHSNGLFTFFLNEDWSKSLFLSSELYVPLLANITYFNLDEHGMFVAPGIKPIEGGSHSITSLQSAWSIKNNMHVIQGFDQLMNRSDTWTSGGYFPNDNLYHDYVSVKDWAGVLMWRRGRLKEVHENALHASGHEFLAYHIRRHQFKPPVQTNHTTILIRNMAEYGYLLPTWVPLKTHLHVETLDFPH
jgi:hypothetical protein